MTKLITTQKMMSDYFGGRTAMTLHRWLKNDGLAFPRPVYISKRRYFKVDEIEGFIRRQSARAPASAEQQSN